MHLPRLLLLGLLQSLTLCAQVAPESLAGLWRAPLGGADNGTELYLKIQHTGEGRLKGAVAAPAFADAYMDMALPQVVLREGTLDIGLGRLQVASDAESLTGDFSFFGPVAKLRFVRCERLPVPELDRTPATAATVAWEVATGGELWSTPCDAGDRVIFGSDDGLVRAVSPVDGTLLWGFQTKGRVRAEPVCDATRVFVAGDDGVLYALERKSGALCWSLVLDAAPAPRSLPHQEAASEWDYSAATPLVQDGRVYVGSAGGAFVAVDAASGRKVWERKVGAPIRAGAVMVGELLVFGDWAGKVHALNCTDGREVWVFDAHLPVTSTAAPVGGDVVLGSRYSHLWRIDGASGLAKWTYNYWWSWVESAALIEDNRVFIGSSDARKVFALDAASGGRRWETRTHGYPWMRPTLHGKELYVGTLVGPKETPASGFLYALDAASGRIVRKCALPARAGLQLNGVSTRVLVKQGLVLFGACDGTLRALRL